MTFKVSRLGDIAEIIDSLHKTPKYAAEGKPMVRVTDVKYGPLKLGSAYKVNEEVFKEFSCRYTPSVGDIVITRVGSYGNTSFVVNPDFCLGQNTAAIIPKISSRYLFLALNSDALRNQIDSLVVGSTQKTLSLKAISNLQIPRFNPDLENFIAEVGSQLDDKIEFNHQINQTLEQMAQALFKSWFVDFEPVKAKIAARQRWQALQPENEPASPVCYAAEFDEPPAVGDLESCMNRAAMQAIAGKTAAQLDALHAEDPERYRELYETAALFPSAMQASELGEIPEGWEALPLSQMIKLIGGGTPKKSEPAYWNGEICWFSVKDAPQDGNIFVIDTEDKITEKALKNSPTKLLPIGTTIITARGTVGKLALTGVLTAMNQSCYGIVGSDGTGSCLNYLRIHKAVDTLKKNSHGAVFDTITRATFDTVLQPQAPLDLRQRFEEVVMCTFEAIKNNLRQSKTLSELRDTLLPKLLSGELTVPDAEAQLAEVADA